MKITTTTRNSCKVRARWLLTVRLSQSIWTATLPVDSYHLLGCRLYLVVGVLNVVELIEYLVPRGSEYLTTIGDRMLGYISPALHSVLQPKADNHYSIPWRMEGWVNLGTAVPTCCMASDIILWMDTLKADCCIDVSGIRPDRSKGGRYKLAQSTIYGDYASRPAISSTHLSHSSSGKCCWSLNFLLLLTTYLWIILFIICWNKAAKCLVNF